MQIETDSFDEEKSKLLQEADLAVTEKKELLENCKGIVDAIKKLEEETGAEGRRISDELKIALEVEKKLFKAGHEERLQKFVAGKISEFKANTHRALAPEISRLQQKNAALLVDIDHRYAADERRMRLDFQDGLASAVAQEVENFKSDQSNFSRSKLAAMNKEIEDLEREHKRRLERDTDGYERELEKLKDSLHQKSTRHRKQRQNEAVEALEASKKRIASMHARHEEEMSELQLKHDESLKQLRDRYAARIGAIEIEAKHVGSAGEYVHESFELELNEFRRNAEAQRDKRIQSEIRQVQSEAIRQEREGM
jgi:hypothetical protein